MKETKVLTEVAVLLSLAVVIEVIFMGISAFLPVRIWVYGGMISVSMLPLFIISYRNGLKMGIYAGVAFGLLNFLLTPFFLHWAQFLLDYSVAFGLVGLGYIGVKIFGKNSKGFSAMVIIGVLLRFIAHYISGVIFFESVMPSSFDNIYLYSLLYNMSYLLPSMILIIIVGLVLLKRIEQLNITL